MPAGRTLTSGVLSKKPRPLTRRSGNTRSLDNWWGRRMGILDELVDANRCAVGKYIMPRVFASSASSLDVSDNPARLSLRGMYGALARE